MITITVGRSSENQIEIDNMSISRNHARIEVDDFDRIYIIDLSRNGTFINGQRIFANLRKQITRNDHVNFAKAIDLDWSLIPKARINETIANQYLPPPMIKDQPQGQKRLIRSQQNFESLSFMETAISFLVPGYGIVRYFIYRNSAPKKSVQALTYGFIGLGVGLILMLTSN